MNEKRIKVSEKIYEWGQTDSPSKNVTISNLSQIDPLVTKQIDKLDLQLISRIISDATDLISQKKHEKPDIKLVINRQQYEDTDIILIEYILLLGFDHSTKILSGHIGALQSIFQSRITTTDMQIFYDKEMDKQYLQIVVTAWTNPFNMVQTTLIQQKMCTLVFTKDTHPSGPEDDGSEKQSVSRNRKRQRTNNDNDNSMKEEK
jgi:hypothetical protein